MNITSKYPQSMIQGQQTTQPQQFLLQQLQQTQQQQQNQSQQPQHYNQQDTYNDNITPSTLLAQTLYQGNYQRNQQQQQQQQQSQLSTQQNQNSQLTSQPNQQAQQNQQQQLSSQQQAHQVINSLSQQPYSITLDPNLSSTVYWQHQITLCQASRKSNVPHYYARQAAQATRKKTFIDNSAKQVSLPELAKSLLSTLEETEVSSQASNPLLQHKKLVQDLDEQEEQRMKNESTGKQLWCSLDFSGQEIINLSLKIFEYDFLQKLYLCNNRITVIPKEISKLRNLRYLDLSNNQISDLPSDLGMLFKLRYLFLFDNSISFLPSEFGNLFELEFLGIEGNPLNIETAKLLAEKGTRELIIHLRDQAPEMLPPIERQWLLLQEDGEIVDPNDPEKIKEHQPDEKQSFTLMTYNTLCQHYATPKMYKYTPSWALNWEFRRANLKQQIIEYSSDILCLQEVETRTFDEFWTPILEDQGYKGVFHCKTRARTMNERDSKKVDGCATFFKKDKFILIKKETLEYGRIVMTQDKFKKTDDVFNRFMNKDNIASISLLQHIESGQKILIANTHLHWDPAFNDVKTMQVGVLVEELQQFMKRYKSHPNEDIKNMPLIICGDFNSQTSSAVYQLLSQGLVTKHPDIDGRDYGRFTAEGFSHPFKLKSAYDNIGELPFTNLSPTFTDVIDYIWYSTPTLSVRGLLGKIDTEYLKHCIGFPNAHFPSDHIPLITKFTLKKSKESKKPDFKPDFKSGSSSRKT